MATSLGTVSWGSSPTISIALSYDYSRSGANMIYNVHVSVQPVTGASYFGYPIYVEVKMDGSAHGSGTIKAASPSQWGSAINWSTGSQTISNKTSGTTSLSVRIYSGSGSSRNTTYSFAMAVSPAGSTLTASNGTLGTSQTITINKQNAAFTDTVAYTCGTASGTIVTDTLSGSVNWTPPVSLSSQNTSGTSVSVTLTTTTKSSGTTIQSNSITITCAIPASVKPSCTVAISDPTGYATTYGAYVQSKSTLKAVISATTSYSSPINTYKLTADGNTYTTQTTTTPVLQNTGAQNVVATVTDKRGRVSSTASASYTVLAYAQPKTTAFSAYRCDSDGTQNPEGHYMRIAFTGQVTALNNHNAATYVIRYRVVGAGTWTSITCSEISGNYTGSCTPRVLTATDANAYDVEVRITDDFGTVVAATAQIPIAFTIMNWRTDGDGMAIGGINTKAGLQIYMDTELKDRNLEEVFYRLGGWSSLDNNNQQMTSVDDVINRATKARQYNIFVSGATAAFTETLTGISEGGILIAKWAAADRIDYICNAGNSVQIVTGSITISTKAVAYRWVGGQARAVGSTYTLTKTAGNTSSHSFYANRSGNVVVVNLGVVTNASTAVGSNVFAGTLSGGALPARDVTLCGYYGSSVLLCNVLTDGTVNLRVLGASLASGATVYVRGVFLCA